MKQTTGNAIGNEARSGAAAGEYARYTELYASDKTVLGLDIEGNIELLATQPKRFAALQVRGPHPARSAYRAAQIALTTLYFLVIICKYFKIKCMYILA